MKGVAPEAIHYCALVHICESQYTLSQRLRKPILPYCLFVCLFVIVCLFVCLSIFDQRIILPKIKGL